MPWRFPQTAAPHADDLVITVTALNDIGEQSVWTGTASVIKGVYIYGDATVSKSNKEYSMPMVQTPSSNEFTFKTYVEAAGDGFLLWTGDYTEDSDHFRTVNAFIDWGKQDGTTVSSASSEPSPYPRRDITTSGSIRLRWSTASSRTATCLRRRSIRARCGPR